MAGSDAAPVFIHARTVWALLKRAERFAAISAVARRVASARAKASKGATVTARPTWPHYGGRRLSRLAPGATYEEGISVLIDSRCLGRVLNLRANKKHSGGAL
jgi:hypothetical protein